MLNLVDMTEAYERGRQQYCALDSSDCDSFYIREEYGKIGSDFGKKNRIARGDNLTYMRNLLNDSNMAGKLQLIYVDPPFFSKCQYEASARLESEKLGKSSVIKLGAYNDRWEQGLKEYLTMLTTRLLLMRDLLSETGCIWMHLDWHVIHYVKVIMDQIFGEQNFINEIIWTYKSGGVSKRRFARKHDTLLVYSKSGKYKFNPLTEKSYNRGLKPYRFKGIEEFCDEVGWYTNVNMKDVWSIDMVGRTSSERTGYATQKPEKLMERIIASCTDEGDICADFFAGSGTMGAVCEKTGRRWLMCDKGELAVAEQIQRLGDLDSSFYIEDSGGAKTSTGEILRYIVEDDLVRLVSYEAEIPDEQEKCRKEINKYIQEDSLSLIKCWSVGIKGSDGVHRADRVVNGGRDGIELSSVPEDISVVAYDVFGRYINGVRID